MKVRRSQIRPIRDHVLVADMNFDEQYTASGIFIPSDDGKSEGVKPRWCRVWAIGPEQTDFQIDEWIFVEHGRWTRGVEVEEDDGTAVTIRRVDLNAIMLSADEKPNDIEIGQHASPTHGASYDPASFIRPT
jgi:co-chaperonin GroES (HSP10)